MAYIRKRGSSWSFTVDTNTDGERRQLTRGGFRTKREAEVAAGEVESDVAKGLYVKETKMSFQEYAAHWRKFYAANNPKPATLRNRDHHIKTLNDHFGHRRIAAISRKDYRSFILESSQRLARQSLHGLHNVARQIFKLALVDGDIKIDPTEHIRLPSRQSDDVLPKYMEKSQLAEFLDLAKKRGLVGDYETFLLLAYTGLRVGELCALKWSDLDFDRNSLTVNGTLYRGDGRIDEYKVVAPKNKTSRRTIEVDEAVMGVLEAWKARQNAFNMLHRDAYRDEGFVFGKIDEPHRAKNYGLPPHETVILSRMRRLIQWMDKPLDLTTHSLRHTHVSLLAEAGASLEAIAERLGHKNDNITRLVYLHVTETMKKDTATKFSQLMSGVVKI